jgi:alkanesulfonate monooxygenase SsuD/methylene tetrahydromethanopterin reductase-like flavin-dependent oxidoreductase (luciferase family)
MNVDADAFAAEDRFPTQVQETVGYMNDALPPDYPFHAVKAMPAGPSSPEVWLLGSSDYSGSLAAYLGLRFSFAHFIVARRPGGMRGYHDSFRLAYRDEQPYCMVAVFASVGVANGSRRLASSIDRPANDARRG